MSFHTRLVLGVLAASVAAGAAGLVAPAAATVLTSDQRGGRKGKPHAKLRAWTRAKLVPFVATLGPYALIELILPGGTLIALLLWLHNHRHDPDPLVATSSHASPPGLDVPSMRPERFEEEPRRIGLLLLPPAPQNANSSCPEWSPARW